MLLVTGRTNIGFSYDASLFFEEELGAVNPHVNANKTRPNAMTTNKTVTKAGTGDIFAIAIRPIAQIIITTPITFLFIFYLLLSYSSSYRELHRNKYFVRNLLLIICQHTFEDHKCWIIAKGFLHFNHLSNIIKLIFTHIIVNGNLHVKKYFI